MTSIATTLTALLAAGAVALSGGGDDIPQERVALVVDASVGRDGRELVDPRLRGTDAEVRLPRTALEARTNIRYFSTLGYRVVVVGPSAQAAAEATGAGIVTADTLPAALVALAER